MLAAARRAGPSVAIDDFGVGFSSLQYLEQLPLGALQRGANGAASVWVVDPANSTLKAAPVTTGAYGSETV
ncbi:hypothetical protein ACS229_31220, partial [Klebsiella pneumoniae]|uniref:hypothetical protein n=1 Tax=Klebsiella pneumoniae TaxID=573 RepID=UPI003F206128